MRSQLPVAAIAAFRNCQVSTQSGGPAMAKGLNTLETLLLTFLPILTQLPCTRGMYALI